MKRNNNASLGIGIATFLVVIASLVALAMVNYRKRSSNSNDNYSNNSVVVDSVIVSPTVVFKQPEKQRPRITVVEKTEEESRDWCVGCAAQEIFL